MNQLSPDQVGGLLGSQPPGASIYLVGAGGCGVSGLGHLLLDLGFSVHGSDAAENEEIRQLRRRGAVIHIGHEAGQLRAANPILVVYSPAVARGKTTTSALLAFALEQLGVPSSYAIGAFVPQLERHARLVRHERDGNDTLFVAEADESDGTLRQFKPACALVLNVDAEHLDHFGGLDAICREFQQFVDNASELVVFCADDARVAEITRKHRRAASYGFNRDADYRVEVAQNESIGDVHARSGSCFSVWHHGRKLGEFTIRLFGEKNISNAAAAIALLHELGYAAEKIASAIAGFRGAARRQQELFANPMVRIYDDYGHHPSEIQATLRAFKSLPRGRLVVAFQPHRYTRTLHLMNDFAEAFADADKLFLTEVYAASEPEIAGANSAALAEAMRQRGRPVEYVPRLSDLPAAVLQAIEPGDVVLFLGAGDITKVAHDVAASLKSGAGPTGTNSQKTAMQTKSSPPMQPVAAPANDRFEQLRGAVSPSTLLRENEPLARRTTLRVGGNADFYCEPATEQDLGCLLQACAQWRLPFVVIGRGSNLLIRDGGIRGVVICLGNEAFSGVTITGEHLHCGAGAKLKAVSVEARRAGLAGLEFLEGIPGSLGGALRMNAGAMGAWIFDVVEQIRFMDFSGTVQERKASEVNVEYRGCPLFKSHIALGAVLHGTPAPREVIAERANTFNAKRWESQPAQPSAGCIFKNPTTVPAGKLIDELGLKGTRRGGAMISTVHGNFIVNEGNATARDVLELIAFVKETAKAKRGIDLETEVEILGD